MSELIAKLEEWNSKDSKVRAVLRRSLSFDPGTHPSAYPYVEWLLQGEENSWHREMHYLVAGLWASHWREGRTVESMSIGKACAMHQAASGSSSVEKRFINLLDADRDQLMHRLRQMVAILKDYTIDFEYMLKGLLYWNDEHKRTQNRWASDFYRNINKGNANEAITNEEEHA